MNGFETRAMAFSTLLLVVEQADATF